MGSTGVDQPHQPEVLDRLVGRFVIEAGAVDLQQLALAAKAEDWMLANADRLIESALGTR